MVVARGRQLHWYACPKRYLAIMLTERLLPRNLHGTIDCVYDGREGGIRHLDANIRVLFILWMMFPGRSKCTGRCVRSKFCTILGRMIGLNGGMFATWCGIFLALQKCCTAVPCTTTADVDSYTHACTPALVSGR